MTPKTSTADRGQHESAEFSRPVSADSIGREGAEYEIVADEAECRALARRFDLVSLTGLKAAVRLSPAGRTGRIRLEGRLAVDVVQTCVVSLEPVASHIEESFSRLFVPADEQPAEPEVVIDPEAEDTEPIVGGRIDIGETVAEEVALALDPYPRAAGAVFPASDEDEPVVEEAGRRPFAVLASLLEKD